VVSAHQREVEDVLSRSERVTVLASIVAGRWAQITATRSS
jgi:hypothetical protein